MDIAGAKGFTHGELSNLLDTANGGNGIDLKSSLLEDSLKYGYLLPGFSPLNWRAECVKVNRFVRDVGTSEGRAGHSYSRLDCALRTCICPKKGQCYFDDLCPGGEPLHGLGCFTDEKNQTCRECGYGEYFKISCDSAPNIGKFFKTAIPGMPGGTVAVAPT
jgi:hypothetical protein